MKKRFVSIFTALALCLCLWPGLALAEDTGNTGIIIGEGTTDARWDAADSDTDDLTAGSIEYKADENGYTLTLNGAKYNNSINIDLSSFTYDLKIVINGENSVNKISLDKGGAMILQGDVGSSLTGYLSLSNALQTNAFKGTLNSYVYNWNSTAAAIYGNVTISSPEESQMVTIAENAHPTIQNGGKLIVKEGGALSIAESASLTIASDGELSLHFTAVIPNNVNGSIVNNGILSFDCGDFPAPDNVTNYVERLKLDESSTGRVQTTDSSSKVTGIYENSGVKKTITPLTGDLNLSDQASASGPENEFLYGYKWEPEINDDGNITSGTLTLTEGFSAEKVIIPDATVTIVTNGECSIGTLTAPESPGGGSAPDNTKLTFSGDGKLIIQERLSLSGGNYNSLTINPGVHVIAKRGVEGGASGVDFPVTIDGTLTANGYYNTDNGGFNVPAIYAGKVAVGDTGTLEVSGGAGVALIANGDDAANFENIFSVTGDGRFTAHCSEYNVRVTSNNGTLPSGIDAGVVIPLGEDFLPTDCAVQITGSNSQIDFVKKDSNPTAVYTGPLTIHQRHEFSNTLAHDDNQHWYPCTYQGCDKQKDAAAHSLKWEMDDNDHWQGCNVCSYKTTHEAHSVGTDYKSDANNHWHECTTCGKKYSPAPHTYDDNQDTTCNACGYVRQLGGGGGSHTHTWSTEWSSDSTQHWHACLGCSQRKDAADHVFDDDLDADCNICGYVREVEPPPPEEHTHAWAETWTHDETHHWHECSAEECPVTENSQKDGYEAHIYDNERDTSCNTCGYVRTVTVVPPVYPAGPETGTGGGSTVRSYRIIVEQAANGSVSSNRTRAAAGSTVTLTIVPDSGFALDRLTVTDSRGNEIKLTGQGGGKFTFSMPGMDVTVRAAFAPLPDDTETPCDGGAGCPSRSFTDLGTVGMWYHEAVDYVLQNGLMNGYSGSLFGPDDNLSRAQLAQILFRKEGCPAADDLMVFSDTAAGAWYAGAVQWAVSQGIAGGYGNGMFGPDDPITREQLAVMLWRYAGSPAAGKELLFDDAGEISDFALEAMRWAVENGILDGYGDGRLDPKGLATRAQIAQMLKNLFGNQEGTE